ncbi:MULTISPECIES: YciC family protein [Pseudomonas]|uniref:Uncharacterized protein UPF0259 n=1 Tax=Ectopseudomonas oleovorans TaxID=301 RepID=A0A3D9EHX3_ECTOL|nr:MULTISPECIES: YciC family protein [Pseudomonas]MDU4057944.1 YciC family protein [Pseudomonas oryzihabitans]RAU42913.1 hypothetical protein DBY63_002045 [Pseudomonas sp. RIT 411]RED01985.1 uncharacterized protein UPF0259 [Pseudomonas oleovorans]
MNPVDILRDSLSFFARNLRPLAVLTLPWLLLEALLRYQVLERFGANGGLWDMLVSLLCYPLYTAALLIFLEARTQGNTPRLSGVWGAALLLWPRFAVLAAVTSGLVMLGFSLLIVPGFLIMAKLAFAENLLVLEGRAPLDALRGSFRLSRGHFFTLLACILATVLPAWLLDAWITRHFAEAAVPEIVLQTLSGFLQLIPSIAVYRIYMLVRQSA